MIDVLAVGTEAHRRDAQPEDALDRRRREEPPMANDWLETVAEAQRRAKARLPKSVYGALIAWVIAGLGMLMLAFVFQTLANRKPDLDAGVYAYARAGFGPYLGFASAFGYWASA